MNESKLILISAGLGIIVIPFFGYSISNSLMLGISAFTVIFAFIVYGKNLFDKENTDGKKKWKFFDLLLALSIPLTIIYTFYFITNYDSEEVVKTTNYLSLLALALTLFTLSITKK